jgi:membrane protease YdiL (CAAX protease family)
VEYSNPKPVSVSPWEAVLVIVVTFFVFLFLGAIILLTVGEGPTLIFGELLILIVPLVYLLYRRIPVRAFVRFDPNPKFILIGLGCGALLLLLNFVVSNALTAIFGVSQTVQQANNTIVQLSSSPSGLAEVAISLALAGICEEFAFRGFLQNSIFQSLSAKKGTQYAFIVAVVIAAGVFGLFHFDPQIVYTLAAFITGLALGFIYHHFNYTTSATAHASMNLMVLALLILVGV